MLRPRGRRMGADIGTGMIDLLRSWQLSIQSGKGDIPISWYPDPKFDARKAAVIV